MSRRLAAALLIGLGLALGAGMARAADYLPGAAEMNANTLLIEARGALHELESLPAGVDRESAYASAIAALTALYQRHGCQWALPALKKLYTQADCPDLHIGWSPDGRVSLRIEPLDLKNPAFADYRILLLTFSSDTSRRSEAAQSKHLQLTLADGSEVEAQVLSKAHPLWSRLDKMAGSFNVPDVVLSGAAVSYKEIFLIKDLKGQAIRSASLDWGEEQFKVDYFGAK